MRGKTKRYALRNFGSTSVMRKNVGGGIFVLRGGG